MGEGQGKRGVRLEQAEQRRMIREAGLHRLTDQLIGRCAEQRRSRRVHLFQQPARIGDQQPVGHLLEDERDHEPLLRTSCHSAFGGRWTEPLGNSMSVPSAERRTLTPYWVTVTGWFQ